MEEAGNHYDAPTAGHTHTNTAACTGAHRPTQTLMRTDTPLVVNVTVGVLLDVAERVLLGLAVEVGVAVPVCVGTTVAVAVAVPEGCSQGGRTCGCDRWAGHEVERAVGGGWEVWAPTGGRARLRPARQLGTCDGPASTLADPRLRRQEQACWPALPAPATRAIAPFPYTRTRDDPKIPVGHAWSERPGSRWRWPCARPATKS